MLEKEKRQNHVSSDQEFAEFLAECNNGTKDYSIELYLRARYLTKFLQKCTQVRIKDLYIIFDNPQVTQQMARSIENGLPQSQILERVRKLEFTHSPAQIDQEFFIVGQLLR